jgi:hypothetical protein
LIYKFEENFTIAMIIVLDFAHFDFFQTAAFPKNGSFLGGRCSYSTGAIQDI